MNITLYYSYRVEFFITAQHAYKADYAGQNKHSRIHPTDKILRSCKERMGIDGNILQRGKQPAVKLNKNVILE